MTAYLVWRQGPKEPYSEKYYDQLPRSIRSPTTEEGRNMGVISRIELKPDEEELSIDILERLYPLERK